MNNPAIDLLVVELYSLRKHKAALEREEKELVSRIKPLVDPHFDALLDAGSPTRAFAGELVISRLVVPRRTISREKLLERGIAPDIIAYATKTTESTQYRITEKAE